MNLVTATQSLGRLAGGGVGQTMFSEADPAPRTTRLGGMEAVVSSEEMRESQNQLQALQRGHALLSFMT